VFPAVTAGLSGLDSPARASIFPNLLPTELISSASAMFQALFQMGSVVGPAIAGLLLAGGGVHFVYWVDVASILGAVACAFLISAQPAAPGAARPSLRSVAEGFRFLKGRQPLQGAYLIDINAMVFGMPRALFPALAAATFGGGTAVLGFLYAAPGAGALVGALTTGWVVGVRRQGLAVTIAVITWGAAIAGFGFVSWLPGALVLLAVAGWADVISAVFRSTILQLATPDELRGRLNAVQTGVVAGGPRLGDLEAGAVATAFTNEISIVSGGLICIVGALALARALPGFRRVEVDAVAGTALDPRLGPAIED
jgi:MFS family permease